MRNWVHIVGGGTAGLSLAAQLCKEKNLPGKIIISDPNIHNLKKKSFGFWFTEKERSFLNPDYDWSSWSFSDEQKSFTQKGIDYLYGLSTGEQFFDRVFDKISSHSKVEIREEYVVSAPMADFIFDSRPIAKEDFWIKQTFVGWMLNCEEEHNFKEPQLMSDMKADKNGLNFRYLLPLTSKQLLVEYTDFSESLERFDYLEDQVKNWCNANISGKFRIDRVESACIPMGYKEQNQHFGIPIGVRGGLARSSTGYSFRASQYWAKEISDKLIQNKPIKKYKKSLRQSWMDERLLWLVKNWPKSLPSIFLTLGEKLTGDHFARFMVKNDFLIALSVILVVPKTPFIISSIRRNQWK